MIAGTLALSPVNVYADAKDDKITKLEAKISDLEKQIKYGDTEIYKYDMESEGYQKLTSENKITLVDFGIDLIPLAINGEYVLFGEASEELIASFKEFKEE